ncbi:MAG: threonine synthase [Oscillospiraceae bacterium]|nr:threonine synthase [Oscillospiraceae bacterium]
MRYLSTRDKAVRVTAANAMAKGLAPDGGLFVPEVLPGLSARQIESLCGMSYGQRAVYIMGAFLKDFTSAEINGFAERAYSAKGFDTPAIAPLVGLGAEAGVGRPGSVAPTDTWFLELWHGPTSAFKDMALQMLPHLLTASLEKTGEERQVCILVATSGDTGKAALDGFADVARTKILVFYPKDGVSDVQRLQMVTQAGANVGVLGVAGNFDDAQAGVKRIFSDAELAKELSGCGWFLSSANSINWGRLLPQIVYYVSAYCDLVNAGRIVVGDKVNFAVPTGNFGNILAGFYAMRMGLPIGRLICASNANNVLTEFVRTGVYDKKRPFYVTNSPSMDILVSSNLERLIFALSGEDDKQTAGYMRALSETGRYTVTPGIKSAIDKIFWADFCDDERTKEVIATTYEAEGYLMDTHTAVAYDVLEKYRAETGDATPAVVVSTASPYKFADSVLDALGEGGMAEGLGLIDKLAEVSGTVPPQPLTALRGKRVRFDETIEADEMLGAVRSFLT